MLTPIMPTRKRDPNAPRYSADEIADRIDGARKRAKLNVKSLAADIWPAQGENARFMYYKKRANRDSEWDYWEISRVCEILKAPPGWPFIDWDYAEALRRLSG